MSNVNTLDESIIEFISFYYILLDIKKVQTKLIRLVLNMKNQILLM